MIEIIIVCILLIILVMISLFKRKMLGGGNEVKMITDAEEIKGVINGITKQKFSTIKVKQGIKLIPFEVEGVEENINIGINAIKGAANSIIKFGTGAIQGVISNVQQIIMYISNLIAAPEKEFANWLLKNPKLIIKSGIAGIKNNIGLVTALKEFVESRKIKVLMETLIKNYGKNYLFLMQSFYDHFIYKPVILKIINVIVSFDISKITFLSFLKAQFAFIINRIRGELDTNAFVKLIIGLLNAENIKSVWNVVINKMKSLFNCIKEVVSGIGGMFKAVWDKAKEFLNMVKGSKVIKGFSKGIVRTRGVMNKVLADELESQGFEIKV